LPTLDTFSLGVADHVHRVFRQWAHRMVEADVEDRPGYARIDQHFGVDRRSPLAAAQRSWRQVGCRLGSRGRVRRDGGTTWQTAHLQDPVLPICHTRFRFPWLWDGRPAVLQSRCADETGYVQPSIKQLVDVRGLNGPLGSIYHLNGIQSWAVAANGSVTNVHQN